MSIRQGAARAVDAACAVLGRRQVVRAARFVLNRARHDGPNRPETNGEHALQEWVLAATPVGQPLTVLDVGANLGDWSSALLERARHTGQLQQLALHAFEPSEFTCALLRERLPTWVRVNQVALSNGERRSTLYVAAAGAGRNSLHDHHLDGPGQATTEPVTTTTVDAYLHQAGISTVDLLKVDTEGHDFRVLAGAEQSLRRQCIRVVQFEYNHRWVRARHFLKDAFDLVQPLGYRVGKVTARGIEAYPSWDPELETFIEGNYVAYTVSLPVIAWWKQRPSGRLS